MDLKALDKVLCGEIWTGSETWQNLLYLCDECGHRFVGSSGYRKAADYVAAKFAAYGLEKAALEPFAARGWQRGPAQITLLGSTPRPVPCIALPYCTPCDIQLELINLGHGTPEEIARHKDQIPGKAALVMNGMPPDDKRYIHRMEKYMRVQEAGAAAFLFIDNNPGYLPITGGLPEKGAAIPGVGLTYEEGQGLVRLSMGQGQRIHLRVESETMPVTSWNIVGELPGTDLADEIVVVGGHLDSHDLCAGATDNASGMVLVLEAARVLGMQKGLLRRTIRFIGFGVEELGLIGSDAYVEAHAAELPRVQFMLNLDVTGANIANALALHGCPELIPYFQGAAKEMAYDLAVTSAFHPYSDHFAFVMAGVPAGSLGHTGGPSRQGYAHTPADTVDKVVPLELQISSMAVTRLLLRIAQADAWQGTHKAPAQVRELVTKSPFADALRFEGRWRWPDEDEKQA